MTVNTKSFKLLAAAIVLLFAITGGLTGLALAGAGSPAPQVNEEAALPASQDVPDDPAIETCGTCHADIVEDWQVSPHHTAYHVEEFQAGWESVDFDPACLDCHTTGFSPATGEYQIEGVSCVACHGAIPEDHPFTAVNLDIANASCQNCHTVTYAEYRASLHEAAGLQCTSCHYSHTNGLRLENELDQCLNCHGHQLDDFAHSSHVNAGLVCRNCHGYVEPGQPIPINGLAPTGHDFKVNITACLDCHEDIQLEPINDGADGFSRQAAEASFTGSETAALRIRELQAAVETLRLQNRNTNATFALQGALGGLMVGGLVVWLYSCRRRIMDKVGNGNGNGNGAAKDE
ncbi:MAG: hypothetical protein Kow00124_23700 [Anaerolineae bacterium]